MIESEARGAWHELETTLRPFIARRVSAPADVDDVLQDVFLRMQRSAGELRDEERFGAWVYRVAKSAIADQRRARARHPLPSDANAEPESVSETDDNSAEQELAACVALFTSMLPSPYREAVTLTDLQGMSQKDAAELLGISHSGMKSRVQRGRKQLRALFEQCCVIACDARGRVMSYEPRNSCSVPTRECGSSRRSS